MKQDGRKTKGGFLWLLALVLLAWSSRGLAHGDLLSRLPRGEKWSAMFGSREARASVKDGLLLGFGQERSELLPDGRLRVVRSRTYTQLKHPDTGKLAKLAEPCRVRSTLELSASLRLLRSDTTLEFPKSVDNALPDFKLSEEASMLFEIDRSRVTANAAGNRLTRVTSRAGKTIESEAYDYPSDAIPLEIVGMVLATAVKSRVEHFDFELLVPSGATHGVRAIVHRTRDLARFARGYRVPKSKLRFDRDMAVLELSLASPVKRLFFPHRFYMVYASEDPAVMLALWGGDPDEHLQAFRVD